MCIRDRALRALRVRGLLERGSIRRILALVGGRTGVLQAIVRVRAEDERAGTLPVGPVSYTHLTLPTSDLV